VKNPDQITRGCGNRNVAGGFALVRSNHTHDDALAFTPDRVEMNLVKIHYDASHHRRRAVLADAHAAYTVVVDGK
jgi:hypothetical protein